MGQKGPLEIRDEIVSILEREKCTVQEAQYILNQASRMIHATATVQFVPGQNHEY